MRITLGLLSRAAAGLRHFVCGLHGHDALLHFEKTRLSLQCASCGYESPGWEIGPAAARKATAAPDARPRVVQMPIARRAA